jgi:hypothetical protein
MKFPAALLTRPSSGRSRQISSNMTSTLSGCRKSHTIWDGVASRRLPLLHGIFENFLPASTYYYFTIKRVPKLLPIPVPPPVISIFWSFQTSFANVRIFPKQDAVAGFRAQLIRRVTCGDPQATKTVLFL